MAPMKTLARSLTVLLAAAATLPLTAAAPASAHETRAGGPVRFVVGWGDEPTYTGFKNSVQVTVTDASGAPVTDVGDTLTVEVIKGAEKTTLPLVANFRVGGFGTPGDYRAWLTPTRPGAYTFRISGTVRGQKVDETFDSGKTTFNDVEDVTSIAFPAKDPSTGQLATRIDREVPRLEAALAEAEESADSARTLALAGTVVGAVGLLTAVGALVGTRRRSGGGTGAGLQHEQRVSEMARPNA
jgi:hypothetical protein